MMKIGDIIEFTCSGSGRGGHYYVRAEVTKVNRKTVNATELPKSYRPGSLWNVSIGIIDKINDEFNPQYSKY